MSYVITAFVSFTLGVWLGISFLAIFSIGKTNGRKNKENEDDT